MSYRNIADIANSHSLRLRLNAAAAQENKPDPEQWVQERRWDIAASPGWDAAWASADAGGVVDPGNNEAVITDAMILAVVQPMQ